MLYLEIVADNLYGIRDTSDNVLEFISFDELYTIVSDRGDNFIRGCFLDSNNKLCTCILCLSDFNCRTTNLLNKVFGTTILMSCGLKLIIVKYSSSFDFLCKSESNKYFEYSNLQSFFNGYLPNSMLKEARKGEIGISVYGQKMTILEYIDSSNITVQFEDGSIMYNIEYGSFKKGYVKNINKRVGEISISNRGEEMKIVEYVDSNNISVKFEDGTVVTDKAYCNFKNGNICNPNYFKNKYEGLQSVASNGQLITIRNYLSYDNSIIEFEDGYKTYGSLHDFFKGTIRNPNFTVKDIYFKSKVGLQSLSLNGQLMTIIDYRGFKDIDVVFEDGYMVSNCRFSHFQNGLIRNPNVSFRRSYLERLLSYQLKLNNINFLSNYKPDWLDGLELDFYIPSLEIAIEVDGYYHGFEKQYKRDYRKSKILKIRNILLIRIRDFCVSSKFKDISSLKELDYIIEADSVLCTDRHSGILELIRITRLLLIKIGVKNYTIDFSNNALNLCRSGDD